MICLSKADKDAIRHLSFNQSPPALAPGHTTRQDLNGISNLREFVDSSQGDGPGGGGGRGAVGGGGMGGSGSDDEMKALGFSPGEPPAMAAAAGQKFTERIPRCKAASGGDGQSCFSWAVSPRCLAHLWGWTAWILSVLFVSCLLSWLSSPVSWFSSSSLRPSVAAASATVESTNQPAANSGYSVIAKRSQCKSGGVSSDEYNTSLHGAALFIIWFVSSLGCAFPILATKVPGLRIPRRFFFAVRHFGTGVLIATAFVHLLPTAFVSLGDPCLGKFWNEDYQAMPGAIALAAIFLVTIIEMVFHPGRHCAPAQTATVCCGARDGSAVEDGDDSAGRPDPAVAPVLPVRRMGSLRGRSLSIGQGLSQLNQSTADQLREQAAEIENQKGSEKAAAEYSESPALTPEQKQRKDRLQCILLEMGILFHSVFIGMALSVSIGSDFIVLLIAIVFHQTFEGLALGSRIAAVKWTSKTWQPWLMAAAYGFTTPLGQAIGLATHTLYSPDSEVGLILVGVMNAISAGLLTFASLVELLSEDFLSDESWRVLRGKSRIMACLLVFFGAFFMSLVGAWA